MIDRSLLLHEIIDSDVNAILGISSNLSYNNIINLIFSILTKLIVKVAGAGLIPEKHLGFRPIFLSVLFFNEKKLSESLL